MRPFAYGYNNSYITPLYNFINDRLVDESAVLRPLSWYLILYVFRYFSRKWQKISDCECPDLIQNETPVRFLYGTQKNVRSDRAESSWHSNWCWSDQPAFQSLCSFAPYSYKKTRTFSVHSSLFQYSSETNIATVECISYGHFRSRSMVLFPAMHRKSADLPGKWYWKTIVLVRNQKN